jgi:hypothetical protein
LAPGAAARPPGLLVEQPAGLRWWQGLQVQFGQASVKARRRSAPAYAQEQHDWLGVQAVAGEGERVQRAAIQPLRIVDQDKNR